MAEHERRTEDLQNLQVELTSCVACSIPGQRIVLHGVILLQVEVETVREEVTFKDHRMCEVEQAVLKEKERVATLEGEVQVCVCWEGRGYHTKRIECLLFLSLLFSPPLLFLFFPLLLLLSSHHLFLFFPLLLLPPPYLLLFPLLLLPPPPLISSFSSSLSPPLLFLLLLPQSLLERMAVEVEKNMRLNSELQEGHSGKEVRTMQLAF